MFHGKVSLGGFKVFETDQTSKPRKYLLVLESVSQCFLKKVSLGSFKVFETDQDFLTKKVSSTTCKNPSCPRNLDPKETRIQGCLTFRPQTTYHNSLSSERPSCTCVLTSHISRKSRTFSMIGGKSRQVRLGSPLCMPSASVDLGFRSFDRNVKNGLAGFWEKSLIRLPIPPSSTGCSELCCSEEPLRH